MGGKLAVLMYHALTDDEGRCADADQRYAIQPAQFARHIHALKEAGLQARSVKSIQTGTSPASTVAMTFDDGHASNAKAAEVLAACSFSADFFVNPSTVGQPNYLSWSELRNMVSAGMSISPIGWPSGPTTTTRCCCGSLMDPILPHLEQSRSPGQGVCPPERGNLVGLAHAL